MLKKLKEVNYGSLATVVGRYYAMDRDKRWERIKIAYEALVQGIGETTTEQSLVFGGSWLGSSPPGISLLLEYWEYCGQ